MTEKILVLSFWIIEKLNQLGTFLPQLGLRFFLAWEFWEAGIMKYQGENWFSSVKDSFPFPFNVVPVEISWFMATWFELIGTIALILGLGTRFFAVSLIIITIVATIAVHLPAEWTTLAHLFETGYDICNSKGGNFKLPLIYVVLFLPLLFSGAGKASLDHLIRWYLTRPNPTDIHK